MRACITIPLSLGTASVALWVASVTLATIETVRHGHGAFALWALLTSAMAAATTVVWSISHAQRTVLDVMSWEHRHITPPTPDKAERVVPMARERS